MEMEDIKEFPVTDSLYQNCQTFHELSEKLLTFKSEISKFNL